LAICPFCDKPKFYIDTNTSRSDCKVCNWQDQYKDDKNDPITGNHYGFIKYLWRISYTNTKPIDYQELSTDRRLSVESLRRWGICKSVITGDWLVPGYGVKHPPNIVQLYRRTRQKNKPDGTPRYELWITPGFTEGESHGIHLPRIVNGSSAITTELQEAETIYICEGVWDAVALDSVLGSNTGSSFERNKPNGNYVVIGVPGCGIFNKGWVRYIANKHVVFLYDNDHPKVNEKTKTTYQPSLSGTKRAVGIMASQNDSSSHPLSVSWLDWNLDGKGYDPDIPDKYDVRDWIKDGKDIGKLLSYVRPVPGEWLLSSNTPVGSSSSSSNNSSSGSNVGVGRIRPIECNSWNELTDSFKLAAKWTPELHGALAVSLACVSSVRGVGEPLWVRLVSPPSTYKSQLCKALGTNDRYTILNDGMNGFFSGMDLGDGKDHSLVARWFDKCLITKEGATLVTHPRAEEIIGQARAIYDGEIEKVYNNSIKRSYSGWRGTWLLAGTPRIKYFDDTELGPRFIDYIIVKGISDRLEDDIVMKAMQEQAGSGVVTGSAESVDNPDYLRARQLTGGYINYLRLGVDTNSLTLPGVPYDVLVKLGTLAKFIERMRGRPSRNSSLESFAEKSLPARVSKQLVKLIRFLALVMQRPIDRQVVAITYKVALDTSDGWAMDLVRVLLDASSDGDEGLEPKTLASRCGKNLRDMESLLMYLPRIGVMEQYVPTHLPFPVRTARFRLTSAFKTLYNQVRSIGQEYNLNNIV
jgi:hypothetical protein